MIIKQVTFDMYGSAVIFKFDTEEEYKEKFPQALSDIVNNNKDDRYFYNDDYCLWDGIPSEPNGFKIAGLSCPCPKCSPRC